jgi:hypothetical protein
VQDAVRDGDFGEIIISTRSKKSSAVLPRQTRQQDVTDSDAFTSAMVMG